MILYMYIGHSVLLLNVYLGQGHYMLDYVVKPLLSARTTTLKFQPPLTSLTNKVVGKE